MTLGQVIKQFREANEMSMDEFSKRSNISKAYISMLENNKDPRGNPPSPRIEIYDKAARAMNVSIDDIMAVVDSDSSVVINSPLDSQTGSDKKYELLEMGLSELGWRIDEPRKKDECDFMLNNGSFSFGISTADLDEFANGVYDYINSKVAELMEESYKEISTRLKKQMFKKDTP